MARPSMSIPDDVLDAFDDAIWEHKKAEVYARDTSRSDVVRELMLQYAKGSVDLDPTNLEPDDSEGDDDLRDGFGLDVDHEG